MPKKLEWKIVRFKASEIPPVTAERLAQMQAIPDDTIDYSDIAYPRVVTRRHPARTRRRGELTDSPKHDT